jgi:hypothetical protein
MQVHMGKAMYGSTRPVVTRGEDSEEPLAGNRIEAVLGRGVRLSDSWHEQESRSKDERRRDGYS